MQLVSLTRAGPNLTAFQFWAEQGRVEGGAPDEPFSWGLDTGLSARPGDGGNDTPPGAGGASRAILEVPATGNAGHALDGQSFVVVLLGRTFTFFLSDGTTPVPPGDFGITITNGDSGSVVAGLIAAAIVPTAFGFVEGGVAGLVLGELDNGNFGVMIEALDPALAQGTAGVGPAWAFYAFTTSTVLVVDVPVIGGQWGHALLGTASKAFVFSGLVNAGDLPTTDGEGNSITYHPEYLTIVAWPIPRGAGGVRAWVPQIVPAAWVPEPEIG
jgi:hypothetical protein